MIETKAVSVVPLLRATLGPGISTPFASEKGDERALMEGLLQRYGMWVHRCVTLNAQVAAAVPFKLISMRGQIMRRMFIHGKQPKELSRDTRAYLGGRCAVRPGSVARKAIRPGLEDAVELESHPVLDLLHDVNPWTSGHEFRVSLYSDKQLFGRAFTHLVGEPQPEQMWRMEPYLTKILPHPSEFVSGFEYGSGQTKVTFRPDEVL